MNLKFSIIWIMISANYVDMITMTNVNFTRCEKFRGWGMPIDNVSESNDEETVIDSSLCANKCMKKSYCQVAAYSDTLNYCSYRPWQYIYLTPMESSMFMIMKDIPVSYVRKDSLASVEEARNLCVSVGQHLITYEQLENLRQHDEFTRCNCGFVANGEQFVPVANYTDHCQYPVGMNPCSSEDAAFCTTV